MPRSRVGFLSVERKQQTTMTGDIFVSCLIPWHATQILLDTPNMLVHVQYVQLSGSLECLVKLLKCANVQPMNLADKSRFTGHFNFASHQHVRFLICLTKCAARGKNTFWKQMVWSIESCALIRMSMVLFRFLFISIHRSVLM